MVALEKGVVDLDQYCSTESQEALHNPNSGAAIIREIMHSGDDIGGVEEGLGVSSQKHEKAHRRHRRPIDDSGNRQPHEEVAEEALNRSDRVDRPRPRDPMPESAIIAGGGRSGGVEEAGENAGVGADVLEDGDGVESGLGVVLGGFENGGVDAEGVGGTGGGLDPYARHRRCPFSDFHGLRFRFSRKKKEKSSSS